MRPSSLSVLSGVRGCGLGKVKEKSRECPSELGWKVGRALFVWGNAGPGEGEEEREGARCRGYEGRAGSEGANEDGIEERGIAVADGSEGGGLMLEE